MACSNPLHIFFFFSWPLPSLGWGYNRHRWSSGHNSQLPLRLFKGVRGPNVTNLSQATWKSAHEVGRPCGQTFKGPDRHCLPRMFYLFMTKRSRFLVTARLFYLFEWAAAQSFKKKVFPLCHFSVICHHKRRLWRWILHDTEDALCGEYYVFNGTF